MERERAVTIEVNKLGKVGAIGDFTATSAMSRGARERSSRDAAAAITEAPDRLLSRDDIERETGGGVTRRWLELAAHKGLGPPMIKISRRCVRYRWSEFIVWLESMAEVTP